MPGLQIGRDPRPEPFRIVVTDQRPQLAVGIAALRLAALLES